MIVPVPDSTGKPLTMEMTSPINGEITATGILPPQVYIEQKPVYIDPDLKCHFTECIKLGNNYCTWN